ncbi:MAG: IS21 family transposase [Rhodothermaceae bacterium]|nr:IS21 family transposase [Rhodothermaceae bacterium]MXX97663.1 IS21 family transposase [Rhodothermaceae bacterium]MXZ57980.1 IS21 family transposase [Rhodothermaceae bacterium]MYB90969.1 IS21 family transposase [Rhodothermaceae bacterium]MYD67672.1 IS21 family transposase [Rhodothermaceae bacterium]
MVSDPQATYLRKLVRRKTMTIKAASAKAAMCESSAHKYLRTEKLPSELKTPPRPSRRNDAFAGVWSECVQFLEADPKMEAKALLEYLLDKYPDQFKPSQLRTFQRRVRDWKADRPKEVFFAQVYEPGDRAQSDFTCMNHLGITLQGTPFPHLLYHFVLTYSSWESVMVCESESFASLSAGFQNAVYELGGVPRLHQTDSMSCAVKNRSGNESDVFTESYKELMDFFGVVPRRTQPRRPNENGKVEQRHYRLKRAMENALTLRGSRDFDSQGDYERFLTKIVRRLNACRQSELEQERDALGALPAQRLDSFERLPVRVSCGSTILVKTNRYSVPSTLIGQRVEVRLYVDRIEVWRAQTLQEQMPRLYGEGRHSIHYLHVIRDLVRKPGAFAGYRYRADLFPSRVFRMAYDALKAAHTVALAADKVYLRVLELAANEGESGVEAALTHLLADKTPITLEAVQILLHAPESPIIHVTLESYDGLLAEEVR